MCERSGALGEGELRHSGERRSGLGCNGKEQVWGGAAGGGLGRLFSAKRAFEENSHGEKLPSFTLGQDVTLSSLNRPANSGTQRHSTALAQGDFPLSDLNLPGTGFFSEFSR